MGGLCRSFSWLETFSSQSGLKFSKEPSLVRFFLWLGPTFLAHQDLGLASFSPSLCSECYQSQRSDPIGCHPKIHFFSSAVNINMCGQQEQTGASEWLSVLLVVDSHGHECARNVPETEAPFRMEWLEHGRSDRCAKGWPWIKPPWLMI